MARRMFSPEIVESDAFLEMPTSSQALYFHLGMYADDDGFVNPKKIMRMMSAGEDDLKVLITKRFVLIFENGVVVVKHWRINNLIRKDWYKETKYLEQKNQLVVKENGSYTEVVNGSLTKPTHRLVKYSIGKDRLIAEASSANWLLEDKLKEMEEIENSYKDIIATFIREKPVIIENPKQLSAVIGRYSRVAQKLAGAYSNKQIFLAADKIKEDNKARLRKGEQPVDYTLETIYKQLTK